MSESGSIYLSAIVITRFTDYRDPKPRSREVFSFHQPEILNDWLKNKKTLRARLLDLPPLLEQGLRKCQVRAINKLEKSFKENRPRALIQMATGSGKTYTAITSIKEKLPEIFPRRKEVPKTLIFASSDSHADNIIRIVREEFAEENKFCKKVTYRSDEDPKSVIYYPGKKINGKFIKRARYINYHKRHVGQ